MSEVKESQRLTQEYANQCSVYGDMCIAFEMMKENHAQMQVNIEKQLTKCRNLLVDIRKEEDKERKNDTTSEETSTDNVVEIDPDKNS